MTTTTNPQTAEEALAELITSYHELNGNHIDELEQPPSPLLFMQYVARNRPFVVRKAAVNWPAVSLWSPDYLTAVMGDSTVKVAVTPEGNADSTVWNPVDGKITFAKPLEVSQGPTPPEILASFPQADVDAFLDRRKV
ncbi:MAG: hypothetical protein Q9212_007486 [Teloschistes hypoglaucus]